MTVWDAVVGQPRAVAQLQAAARAPVHAYLFVGPPGSGKRQAAAAFAGALLCEVEPAASVAERGSRGCGVCRTCRLARAEHHPDLHVVERAGPFIAVEQAREIVRQASLSPVEGRRQVLVLVDFHLVQRSAPALLKAIEEPPASTVFVVLAEDVPAELVTIASRCVRVDFGPVPVAVIAETLVAEGVAAEQADEVAQASAGRLDRARLLVADPHFAARREAWRRLPGRLDETGATVAALVDELAALTEAIADPLKARQAVELSTFDEEAERYGRQGGRAALADRHKREVRRLRTDEVRFGLATLAGAYRDAVVAGADAGACFRSVAAIEAANREIVRNPTESLMLQALLLRVSPLPGAHIGV